MLSKVVNHHEYYFWPQFVIFNIASNQYRTLRPLLGMVDEVEYLPTSDQNISTL